MDNSSLKYIKSTYEDDKELIDYFGIEVIQSRIEQIYDEIQQ